MRPMLKTIATIDGFLNRLCDRWPLLFIPVCGVMVVAVSLILYAPIVALVPHLNPKGAISGFILHSSIIGLSAGSVLWWKRRQGY